MCATAATDTAAPASSIQSASTAAHEPTRATDLPETTNVDTAGSTQSTTGATTSGACSITTCAFVPPNPNDDTPARRGRHGRPISGLGNNFQAQTLERDVWIRRLEVLVRWNVPTLYRQHRLDETRDTGRGLQMTQIRLHRSDEKR